LGCQQFDVIKCVDIILLCNGNNIGTEGINLYDHLPIKRSITMSVVVWVVMPCSPVRVLHFFISAYDWAPYVCVLLHKKVKVKQSCYTPWRRLGGEEV
jgi:hypothetical protein